MSTLKLKQEEATPDLIDRINALAIDQSLKLPDGRVITCRADMPGSCDDICCASKMEHCGRILCLGERRFDRTDVYFELTDAPQVDNSTNPNKEESNA